jgi:hypothetical protein
MRKGGGRLAPRAYAGGKARGASARAYEGPGMQRGRPGHAWGQALHAPRRGARTGGWAQIFVVGAGAAWQLGFRSLCGGCVVHSRGGRRRQSWPRQGWLPCCRGGATARETRTVAALITTKGRSDRGGGAPGARGGRAGGRHRQVMAQAPLSEAAQFWSSRLSSTPPLSRGAPRAPAAAGRMSHGARKRSPGSGLGAAAHGQLAAAAGRRPGGVGVGVGAEAPSEADALAGRGHGAVLPQRQDVLHIQLAVAGRVHSRAAVCGQQLARGGGACQGEVALQGERGGGRRRRRACCLRDSFLGGRGAAWEAAGPHPA